MVEILELIIWPHLAALGDPSLLTAVPSPVIMTCKYVNTDNDDVWFCLMCVLCIYTMQGLLSRVYFGMLIGGGASIVFTLLLLR